MIDGLRARVRSWLAVTSGVDALVAAAPPVPIGEIFRRFWPAARPYRRWLWLTLVFVAIGPIIEAAIIWLYKLLIDDVLVPGNFAAFWPIALAYLGLYLLNAGISFGDSYLSTWISGRFLLNLRQRFFDHLQNLSLDFFAGRQLGDVVTRLTGDLAAIEELVVSGVSDTLAYSLRLVVLGSLLIYLQWQLALVALLAAPIFLLLARFFSQRLKLAARERRRRSGSISAVAEESLSNIALVQAYNRQAYISDSFQSESLGSLQAQLASTRLKGLFSPLIDLTELCGMLVVVAFGTWSLAQGRLSLGDLLVFLAYLNQIYRPIRRLSGLYTTVFVASASAERVIELLDQPPAVVERPGATVLARARGRLVFEQLDFQYPGAQQPSLKELSLSIEPGETLAIVGASGAGKSTLARLLLRFYDPTAGRILLDGIDLRDLDLRALRENIVVVFQETALFSGSVLDNIAFARPDAAQAEIVAAAQAAEADEFIRALPHGYATEIGQQGRRLSGGQRQRLAIARALLRNAPILILDEPTASLDRETAQRLLAPLLRLMQGRTVIMITHDLAIAAAASQVAVLEAGRLTELGRPADLLHQGGQLAWLAAGRLPLPTASDGELPLHDSAGVLTNRQHACGQFNGHGPADRQALIEHGIGSVLPPVWSLPGQAWTGPVHWQNAWTLAWSTTDDPGVAVEQPHPPEHPSEASDTQPPSESEES